MHATEALAEAERLMTVCNSCRYCEGLCAVFPAMEMRRSFADGDLNYLANLCHGCGACHDDCQFSPPHAFQVNVPKTLAIVRNDSYAQYAWPPESFISGTRLILYFLVLGIAAFTIASWRGDGGTGFYTWLPHAGMAWIFSVVLGWSVILLYVGARQFWHEGGPVKVSFGDVLQAMRHSATLKYLDGGGMGCETPGGADKRKHGHHATAYGFALCFAATSVATIYHYAFGWEAPYPWYDAPVILGTLGGIGLLIGPISLLRGKLRRNPELGDASRRGTDIAFILMLVLTSATGLLLLVFRATSAMNTLLAIHLGVVLALFALLPYTKSVHGLYRFLALVRSASEQRRLAAGELTEVN
jgi:citrate/tricarballylate utilization protein